MKNHPVHQNLDTSFVNLSALVRYLRSRQFAGNIRVEINGYEADIMLDETNRMTVREHDRIAGRIAEGEEAFQRLLIRAREPGGVIHVYQSIAETEIVPPKIPVMTVAPENKNIRPFIQREALAQISINGGKAKHENKVTAAKIVEREAPLPMTKNNAPLPLEFSNRVEDKARQTQIAPEDWQNLLQLTAELLSAVDETLAAADLNFSVAFAKACAEISDDYPFLNPSSGAFTFAGGRVTMREQISAQLFAASINEALRRILEKLAANPKFSAVYRDAVQQILSLIHHRKSLYDKFFITPQLEKNLGV